MLILIMILAAIAFCAFCCMICSFAVLWLAMLVRPIIPKPLRPDLTLRVEGPYLKFAPNGSLHPTTAESPNSANGRSAHSFSNESQ